MKKGSNPPALRHARKLEWEGEFAKASITSKSQVYSYDEAISIIQGFSATSNMDVKGKVFASGSSFSRQYVCYKDLSDPESAVYIMKVITKL
jgi:hypothetical protein